MAAKGPFKDAALPVGSYSPIAWGICDIHGNVEELCSNEYTNELPGGLDPPATVCLKVSYWVVRGGYWFDHCSLCRSASRNLRKSDERCFKAGFRVAAVQLSQ